MAQVDGTTEFIQRRDDYILEFTENGWIISETTPNGQDPITHIGRELGIARRVSTLDIYDLYQSFRLIAGHASTHFDGKRLPTMAALSDINLRAQFLTDCALEAFVSRNPDSPGPPTRVAIPKHLVQDLWETTWRQYVNADGLTELGKEISAALVAGTDFMVPENENLQTAIDKLSPENRAWVSQLVEDNRNGKQRPVEVSFNDVDGTLIPDKLTEAEVAEIAAQTNQSPETVRSEYEEKRIRLHEELEHVLVHNMLNGVEEILITGRNATELLPIATQIVERLHSEFESLGLGEAPAFRAIVGNGTKLVEYKRNELGEVVCELIDSVELQSEDIDRLIQIIAFSLNVSVDELVDQFDISDNNIIDARLPWVKLGDSPTEPPPTIEVNGQQVQAPFWVWVGDPIIDGGEPKANFVRLRQVKAGDDYTRVRRALEKSDTITVSEVEDIDDSFELLLTNVLANKGSAIKSYVLAKRLSVEELTSLTHLERELIFSELRYLVEGRGNGPNDAELAYNSGRVHPTVTRSSQLDEYALEPTPDPPAVKDGPFADTQPLNQAELAAQARRKDAKVSAPCPSVTEIATRARIVRSA